ncbi:MAG: LPS-assembly protein LptD [Cyclobacteriaceae bacterium]|nr:LPS-assembly protein LptD [Cyclobacteriaceae bacterium]MCH8514744.1 LPS-assembly protein LptD [Cyclobacteriaceae bacterium]
MCFISSAKGQELLNDSTRIEGFAPEMIDADSLLPGLLDVVLPDSIPEEPPKKEYKSDIETTIKYKAKDSINFNIKTRNAYLYGEASIDYGDIDLEAEFITIDYITSEINAIGKVDSTGKKIGMPIFRDKQDEFATEEIRYNFKTGKAKINKLVTQQDEAFIHGRSVKKNQFDELYIDQAKYTTCNLAEPHFHIQASRLKMIPDDKIVSGPFNLRIEDIPTPLGFAFGMFPAPRKETSGVVIPSYGEERLRGLFLRDGGYFWKVNDYVNITALGEIYSRGGHGLNISTDYNRRYRYNGRFNFRYNQLSTGAEEDTININDFWVTWNHTPTPRGKSRFSASVNAGTSTYNQNVAFGDINRNLNSTFTSNVQYSTTFGSLFNMSISARHNQNVRTNEIDVLLPEVAFNMNRIYPFKGLGKTGKTWWEKINFNWQMNATNRITNSPIRQFGNFPIANFEPETEPVDFSFANASQLMQRAQNGVRHRVPVNTSMTVLKHWSLNPSFNYEEVWYLRSLDFQWLPDQQAVQVDTIPGFARASNWNIGASLNTRIYGTYFFPGKGKVEAIRHVLNPIFSFTYTPDFGDPRFGVWQEVQTGPDAAFQQQLLSSFQGFAFGGPQSGPSGNIGIGFTNTLEMKVRSYDDSTGEKSSKKVAIFENLSVNTSYNAIADSFQLQNININARTRLFNDKLDINILSSIDPYTWVLDNIDEQGRVSQRRISEFAINTGNGLGRLSLAQLALSTNLNPAARGDRVNEDSGLDENTRNFINANPDLYVDFSIPWSLMVRYNLRYQRAGFAEPNITQALNLSGDLSLSEKWKIGMTTGYDFTMQDFTQTSIDIFRDLHCWEMRFNWTPFGRFESYSLNINVKASVLQDLKLSRRRTWFDR